jgi:hypothetical protein
MLVNSIQHFYGNRIRIRHRELNKSDLCSTHNFTLVIHAFIVYKIFSAGPELCTFARMKPTPTERPIVRTKSKSNPPKQETTLLYCHAHDARRAERRWREGKGSEKKIRFWELKKTNCHRYVNYKCILFFYTVLCRTRRSRIRVPHLQMEGKVWVFLNVMHCHFSIFQIYSTNF